MGYRSSWLSGLVFALALAGFAATALWLYSSSLDRSSAPVAAASLSAPAPFMTQGIESEYPFAVVYGRVRSAPVLEIWEDFQCVKCARFEESPTARQVDFLADQGAVRVVRRMTSLHDEILGNDSSARATAAYGCALDAGVGPEFRTKLFSSTPPEGVGFSRKAIMSAAQPFLSEVDLKGFAFCVDSGRYLPWAANSTVAFKSANLDDVPVVTLDGVPVPDVALMSPRSLREYVSMTTTVD